MASEKTATWTIEDGVKRATFRMSIKGADLPKDREWTIMTTILIPGDCPFDGYKNFIAGGSSARVTLQKMLREKCGQTPDQKVAILDRLQRDGLEIDVRSVGDPTAIMTFDDQVNAMKLQLSNMPANLRDAALAAMAKEAGITE